MNGLEHPEGIADVCARAKPKLPVTCAASSDKISPKRLVETMTSNVFGFLISCIAAASTWSSSIMTSRYFCETSLTAS